MKRLSNKQKLILILVIAAIALILQYVFHYPLFAQILVTVVGGGGRLNDVYRDD